MIERMIIKAKQLLPLMISEILWDGTMFHMYGSNWSFFTLSAWRISTINRVIFGCYDNDSMTLINSLKNVEILDIDIQTSPLTIDPVFILSNGQKIEIFSTDTYEAWTFQVGELGLFIGTPNEPNAFDRDSNLSI